MTKTIISEEPRHKRECRSKKPIVSASDIEAIKSQYQENIKDIKRKFSLVTELRKRKEIKEAQEILRSQIVFLDSSLDYYFHGVVLYGLKKILNGDWSESEAFRAYKVDLGFAFDLAKSFDKKESLFDEHIVEGLFSRPFMDYEQAKKHLTIIGIGSSSGCPFSQQKDKMTKLYKRRNQIAHQTDRIPGETQKQAITIKCVQNFIKDANEIVKCVNKLIDDKNTESGK